MEAADTAAGSSSALGDGSRSRRLQDWQDRACCVRGDLGNGREPSMDVSLEAKHVSRAGVALLTGNFEGDATGEEDAEGIVDQPVKASLPRRITVRL